MTWSPRVAAIIPCFNAAEFVADAIHSALAQTYPHVEVVVIDDGSTDDLETAIRPFTDRIRFVRQHHRGQSAARNRGMREVPAELFALLDADDRWHPEKIERQIALLESRPECCLVYTARRLIDRHGQSVAEGTTWYRLPPNPVEGRCLVDLVRGNRLMSSSVVFRQAALCGMAFDESLEACEDWDLWLRVAEHQPFAYLPEALTDIRVHDRNMMRDTERMHRGVVQVWRRVVRRRPSKAAVEEARRRLLSEAHREFESGNLAYARDLFYDCFPRLGVPGLVRFAATWLPTSVRAFARLLWRSLSARLSAGVPKPVFWGGLRRVTPVARSWFERGRPVDRHYIESFLAKHQDDIRGEVLEIGDAAYTRRFGGARVSRSHVLHVEPGNPHATFVGNLETGFNVPKETFDCIILTQTLLLIYDVRAAVTHCFGALKPGGVALATVPGISQLCRPEADRWGDFWRFTTLSLQRLFAEVFGADNVSVEAFGNVLAATAFLHNLSADELEEHELRYQDPDYQLVVAARAIKLEPARCGRTD